MSRNTIRGSVNVALLEKADRLFRNDDEGIWIEVLQNARRAGATLISVAIEEASPDADSCTVTVEDNGRGIADFQTLVTLGRSGWPQETEAAEDPAGMGFYSLCHSDVEVHSGRKSVRISRAVFLGKASAQIEKRKERVQGTRIRFQRPSTRRSLAATLGRVTEFMPVEVRLEGNVLPRHDFLEGALYRERIDGIEVGFAKQFTFGDDSYSDLNWNFYGARLRQAPLVVPGLLGDNDQILSLSARFQVLETAAVKLQLPDRKGILEDAGFREFHKKATAAAYRFFQTQSRHALAHANWREAHSLGVELPEAVPLLAPWCAAPQDDSLEPVFEHSPTRVLDSLDNIMLVSHYLPHEHTLSGALHSGANLNETLYREDPKFQGYSWYDRLPTIVDTAVLVDEVPYEKWCKKEHPRPTRIAVELTIEEAKKTREVCLPAVIHVDSESSNDLQFVAVENSPWDNEKLQGPFSVEDFLMAATFLASDDIDADSWDTQEGAYRSEVEQAINEYFRGPRASLRAILRGAITWQASRLAKELGVEEIRFTRNGNEWDVELLDVNRSAMVSEGTAQPS